MEVVAVEQDPRLAARACCGAASRRRHFCTWPKPWPTPGIDDWGVNFAPPKIDVDAMRDRKEKAIATLTGGLKQIAAKRNVQVIQAKATFEDSNTLKIEAQGDKPLDDDRLPLRALHHCHRFRPGDHSRLEPAHASRDGFHRRAICRTCQIRSWSWAADTSAWKWAPSMPPWAAK